MFLIFLSCFLVYYVNLYLFNSKINIMKQRFRLKVAASLFVAAFPLASFAQNDEVKLVRTGTPWGVMGISSDGNWICGTRQYEEVYRFNAKTGKLENIYAVSAGDMSCASDVTDDGMVVGINSEGLPSVWKALAAGWEALPVSVELYGESAVNSCTGDGKYLVGYCSVRPSENPYAVVPTLWEKQQDGTYKDFHLPVPEKDFFGGTPQFVSPRVISADGRTVMGPLVVENGFAHTPLVYKKDDVGNWTYSMPFVPIVYNMDRYLELKGMEPDYKEMVTAPSGTEEWWAQYEVYEDALNDWNYLLCTEGLTGKNFSSTPLLSDNGRFICGEATSSTYYRDEYGIVQEEKEGYTAYLDLQTGEYVELSEGLGGMSPNGISNYGDIVTNDGYDMFIVLHDDYSRRISVGEWLKENYGFDLKAALPSNVKYIDSPVISGEGSTVTGRFRSVITDDDGNIIYDEDGNEQLDVQEIFCILIPGGTSSIMETLNTPENAYIRINGGILSVGGEASSIDVFDMLGKRVMQSRGDNVNVSGLKDGIYIVSAVVGGNNVRAKVIKK